MARVTRICPICSHPEATPLRTNTMASIGGFDLSYTVARCGKCGFLFANTLPDEATYFGYYSAASKYDFAATISETERVRIDAAVDICSRIVPRDAVIVDVGCGYGALLSRFKAAGYANLYGLDPAPNSAAHAKELFGLENIYRGTIGDAARLLPIDKAGLVCVMAVLEHLPALRSDVQALLTQLKPGCRVLVEVPALECFDGQNGEPFGEFSLEHIQFFSLNSLTNLMASLGAQRLAGEFLEIPSVTSGSLFSLFEVTGNTPDEFPPSAEDDRLMEAYIAASQKRLDRALARIPVEPFIIYGAGSHTARLLPLLRPSHTIAAIVDGNPNLQGKTIGGHAIQPPAIVDSMPQVPILISSFNSRKAIAAGLRERATNPLVEIYD